MHEGSACFVFAHWLFPAKGLRPDSLKQFDCVASCYLRYFVVRVVVSDHPAYNVHEFLDVLQPLHVSWVFDARGNWLSRGDLSTWSLMVS